jgi:hypothetical protein
VFGHSEFLPGKRGNDENVFWALLPSSNAMNSVRIGYQLPLERVQAGCGDNGPAERRVPPLE